MNSGTDIIKYPNKYREICLEIVPIVENKVEKILNEAGYNFLTFENNWVFLDIWKFGEDYDKQFKNVVKKIFNSWYYLEWLDYNIFEQIISGNYHISTETKKVKIANKAPELNEVLILNSHKFALSEKNGNTFCNFLSIKDLEWAVVNYSFDEFVAIAFLKWIIVWLSQSQVEQWTKWYRKGPILIAEPKKMSEWIDSSVELMIKLENEYILVQLEWEKVNMKEFECVFREAISWTELYRKTPKKSWTKWMTIKWIPILPTKWYDDINLAKMAWKWTVLVQNTDWSESIIAAASWYIDADASWKYVKITINNHIVNRKLIWPETLNLVKDVDLFEQAADIMDGFWICCNELLVTDWIVSWYAISNKNWVTVNTTVLWWKIISLNWDINAKKVFSNSIIICINWDVNIDEAEYCVIYCTWNVNIKKGIWCIIEAEGNVNIEECINMKDCLWNTIRVKNIWNKSINWSKNNFTIFIKNISEYISEISNNNDSITKFRRYIEMRRSDLVSIKKDSEDYNIKINQINSFLRNIEGLEVKIIELNKIIEDIKNNSELLMIDKIDPKALVDIKTGYSITRISTFTKFRRMIEDFMKTKWADSTKMLNEIFSLNNFVNLHWNIDVPNELGEQNTISLSYGLLSQCIDDHTNNLYKMIQEMSASQEDIDYDYIDEHWKRSAKRFYMIDETLLIDDFFRNIPIFIFVNNSTIIPETILDISWSWLSFTNKSWSNFKKWDVLKISFVLKSKEESKDKNWNEFSLNFRVVNLYQKNWEKLRIWWEFIWISEAQKSTIFAFIHFFDGLHNTNRLNRLYL